MSYPGWDVVDAGDGFIKFHNGLILRGDFTIEGELYQVTAAEIKILRDATGVGMAPAKRALLEARGDQVQALAWLRKHF